VPAAEQEYSGSSPCLKVVSEERTSPTRRPWLLAQACAILVVGATASAQPAFVNGLVVAGSTLDATRGSGVAAGRFGQFSDPLINEGPRTDTTDLTANDGWDARMVRIVVFDNDSRSPRRSLSPSSPRSARACLPHAVLRAAAGHGISEGVRQLNTTMFGPTLRRAASMALIPSVIPVLLCLALVPAPVLAQSSVRSATAAPFVPPAVRRVPRFSVSAEPLQINPATQQRVGARDSLRNGAVIGAVIGAAAFGAVAAILCHAYQEEGGPSCVPDTLRFAAIGGAVGAGAGLAIDAARTDRGVTVRLAIRF
jgi:hypothetical protein